MNKKRGVFDSRSSHPDADEIPYSALHLAEENTANRLNSISHTPFREVIRSMPRKRHFVAVEITKGLLHNKHKHNPIMAFNPAWVYYRALRAFSASNKRVIKKSLPSSASTAGLSAGWLRKVHYAVLFPLLVLNCFLFVRNGCFQNEGLAAAVLTKPWKPESVY